VVHQGTRAPAEHGHNLSELPEATRPLLLGAIQSVVALAAHSTTAYLAQPIVFSVLLALAYVGSVVTRPRLGWVLSAARESPALRAPPLGVSSFVLVSLLTGVPPYVPLVVWGIWHARRSFSRLEVPSSGGTLRRGG
jgi:hypothetical protein